jgi:putative DNA methylase
MKVKKKLIEVALPLEAINQEGSRRKRKAPKGYPTTLHKWWAQRPVAAARAVVFSQMVDDPSSNPDLFPTAKAQEKERQRLFRLIEDLVQWDNTNKEEVLAAARDEIWQSWRRACAEHAGNRQEKDLFDRGTLPSFHDPFAGSGAIPLEAQRLGLRSIASDLNPVAVLINKATLEIPPKFQSRPPANPHSRSDPANAGTWKGVTGLSTDIRYYGEWMREEAFRRIGDLYPPIRVNAEMADGRKDIRPYVGQDLTVVAWIWTRTVKSPNPAFSEVEVPLASTFSLSTKPGNEAYVEAVVKGKAYHFEVRSGKPKDAAAAKRGTKSGGSHTTFLCLMSDTPIPFEYLRSESRAGRMGTRLMAIVAEGKRGRLYLPATPEHEAAAREAEPQWKPDVDICHWPGRTNVVEYGLTTFGDLFTKRQLVVLTTLADLVPEAVVRAKSDALLADTTGDTRSLRDGGTGSVAYAEAIGVYLAFAVDRVVDYCSSIATWRPKDSAMRSTLAKQALPMTWDFAEGSPFADSSAGFTNCVDVVSTVLTYALANVQSGFATQTDAAKQLSNLQGLSVISTDPPYYDNIGYADLSDFFYVWLRRSLRAVFPELFATLAVPKAEELVASPYRHGGKKEAETFFLKGMTEAMKRMVTGSHPAFPVTIYYAFKQSETETDEGTASTGWQTFLDAVIHAGFSVTGTWPVRTEGDNRQAGIGANALASSIVLVCRPRSPTSTTATRREFLAALKAELPEALEHLQKGNIAPVDLAQAAIGPGMAVFTRYSKVLDAAGDAMAVREALTVINEVLDEALSKQEGDFDPDSRWALAWFEQHGFSEGEYGVAETLSKAKNTSVSGLQDAGILKQGRGKVRLLTPDELPADWDPTKDVRLTAWESVHHMIRALITGEKAAADLLAGLGSRAEAARELAYRLYVLCDRKKWAAEALAYNSLVQSWPEIVRLAKEGKSSKEPVPQSELFEEE